MCEHSDCSDIELDGLPTSGKEASGGVSPGSQSPYRTTTMVSRSRINLYLACVIANLSWFTSGTCVSWTSPTLPRLLAPNDILLLTQEQAAWVGSLMPCGAVFGPFLAGALMNRVGRKWTTTLSVVCITLSWLLLLFARNVGLVYLARVIAGVGVGITFAVGPMYVGEIAEDNVRGALGSMLSFFLCLGFLLEYIVGPYVSYTVLIIVSLVPPILFLLMFSVFMPETPYYLLQKGRDTDAFNNLSWLRKNAPAEDVRRELNTMKASVEAALQQSGTVVDLLSSASNRKALLLSCGLISGQQLSGASAVIFYAESIFLMAGTNISASLSPIVIGAVLLVSNGVTAPLVKRFGMKILLIISAVGMAIFQGLLGFYFYLHHQKADLSSLNWLPIASLIGYITMFAIGFSPLPWAVMAEVFPSNVKALGSSISASCCSVIGFITTKYFIDISTSFGEYTSFWMFSFFCVLMVFFTFFLLPDTRGLSFEEIQDKLNNRTKGRR